MTDRVFRRRRQSLKKVRAFRSHYRKLGPWEVIGTTVWKNHPSTAREVTAKGFADGSGAAFTFPAAVNVKATDYIGFNFKLRI